MYDGNGLIFKQVGNVKIILHGTTLAIKKYIESVLIMY
jgi:hypothetical protein